jgi:hypothetical protein
MALILGYRCMTCNVLVPRDEVGLHLQTYPDHSVQQTVIDDALEVDHSPGLTSYRDGNLYVFDPDKNMRLSTSRVGVSWGLGVSKIRGSWLKLFSSVPTTSETGGFPIPIDAVIVKVTANRVSGNGSWGIVLCKNFSLGETVYDMSMTESENMKVDTSVAAVISAGSTLHCYHNSASWSDNVQVWISLAWTY